MYLLKSYTGNMLWLWPANSDLFWSLCKLSNVACWLCFVNHIHTREDLFEEMLQEPAEVAAKRKRCRELLRAYQQAFRVRDLIL